MAPGGALPFAETRGQLQTQAGGSGTRAVPSRGKVLSGGKVLPQCTDSSPPPAPALLLAYPTSGKVVPGLGGSYSADPDPTVPGEVGVTRFVGRGNFLSAPLGQNVGSRRSGCEQIPAGHMRADEEVPTCLSGERRWPGAGGDRTIPLPAGSLQAVSDFGVTGA